LVERQKFVLAVSYHSFGRLCLYPWGYTRGELCADQPLFAALADSMVRSNGYRPGNAYFGTIYLTNGEFCDWMYGAVSASKPNRTLAFTVELNGDGQGFWPAESLIEPTCEIMRPLNLYVLEAAGNPRMPLPPPAPVVAASQDAVDGRRIHLEWRLAADTGNPVERYEVFEVAFTNAAPRSVVRRFVDVFGARVAGDWFAAPVQRTRRLEPRCRSRTRCGITPTSKRVRRAEPGGRCRGLRHAMRHRPGATPGTA
jgi:hypothetical protein